MKRLIGILILFCLLIPLVGCRQPKGETVSFYYRRTRFDYGTALPDSTIAPEQRSIEGHSGNLSYLISLYLAGPLDERLCAVFPKDTALIHTHQAGSDLYISLSDVGQDFPAAQFTLGCAGLALTFLDMTDAETVIISSGERNITLSRDSLTLCDPVTETTTPETD